MPPGPGEELVHKLSLAEIVGITRNGNFMLLTVCVFVMMGIYNAVMTWIEDGILGPRGIPGHPGRSDWRHDGGDRSGRRPDPSHHVG